MQRLERGALADLAMLGEVDHAHAAAPELSANAVLADALADEIRGTLDQRRPLARRLVAWSLTRVGAGVVLGHRQGYL